MPYTIGLTFQHARPVTLQRILTILRSGMLEVVLSKQAKISFVSGNRVVNKFSKLVPIVFFFFGLLLLTLQSSSLTGVVFLSFFGLWPFLVNTGLAFIARCKATVLLTLLASVAYILWFLYGYYDIFHVNIDPQSGISVIFIGIYSMPFMLLIWLAFFTFHFLTRPKGNRKKGRSKFS